MQVINYRCVWEFIERHPDFEVSLNAWYQATRRGNWRDLADIRQISLLVDLQSKPTQESQADSQLEHPYANRVGHYVVFSISHHKIKVVTRILFKSKTVLIMGVYTHEEYEAIQLKE